MFEFRNVELMNWAYWPTVQLPLDQRTIMISGPNGSGKTTFLDALRVLLRAPRLSANRRFTDYLMGNVEAAAIRGTVSNEAFGRDRRPFEFKGFHNDVVTLACLIRQKAGRYERRFVVLEGDVPMEELRNLRQVDLLTPEMYTREIAEAGFSEAFLKVLALEQGQTDKLCEKSPRELLDLLLDVHGDKLVIDRYKQARENYQAANMELTHLGARLAEEQARLMASQRAAENYQRYTRLVDEGHRFETVLIPQAEYKAGKERIGELNLTISDLNLRLKPVDREIVRAEEILDNAETDLQRRKGEVLNARETRDAMEKQERVLDFDLNRLVQERRELTQLMDMAGEATVEPIEPLRNQVDDIRRETVRLEVREEGLSRRLDDLLSELQAVDQQAGKIYPRWVNDFRHVLEREGIDYSLLCDMIEITDPDWQLAVESILGRDRFTVIVDPADQLAARRLAERNKYRCYIVAPGTKGGMRAPRGSALEVVNFTEGGAPDWVYENLSRIQLVETVEDGMKRQDAITVTENGYRQDRRGGVSIAVDTYHCGSLGQSSSKEVLGKEIQDARSEHGQINKAKSDLRMKEQGLLQRIEVQEQLGKVGDAKARLEVIKDELPKANDGHKQALLLKRQAEDKLFAALEELNNYEHELNEHRRVIAERREDQSEYLQDAKDAQDALEKLNRQLARIEENLGTELLTPQALRDVEPVDELTPRFYAVKNLLAEYEEIPDENALHVYEHHKSQYDRQRKIYNEHEDGLRSWETEFRLARQKYLAVVDHTIREYRTNILALSDLAGINSEVIVPNLSHYEENLEQAELQVRFGYDGKKATAIGGSGHSGGQRVVSSLILLMSLATSGGIQRGGFFIIDEPFAHLSLERIDDVSQFLNKTKCQFILTSPTTHNVNVFSAARLQLNFRIKRPDDVYAAVPTVIRR